MDINIVSSGRAFSAQLHYLIYEKLEDKKYLVAASYAGLDTGTRAITAAIIEGRPFSVREDNKTKYFETLKGNYRRVDKSINGPVVHSLILNKAMVFGENQEIPPVILAPDGDIKTAVGKFMMARFALPKEWVDTYITLIPRDGIEDLEVLVNPFNRKWPSLRAVRLSIHYMNEEYIIGEIDQRLKRGDLKVPRADSDMPRGCFDPGWSMREYMTQNAHVLAAQLSNVRPHHVPGVEPLDPGIAELGRIPFPAQAHMIQGLFNTLKHTGHYYTQDSDFCGADMGCGKSIMSLGVAYLFYKDMIRKGGRGISVLLSAPGITVPKWIAMEIHPTIPDAKVRVLASTKDAARYAREVKSGYRPEGIEFVIVGMDRAKLGPEPWPAAIWKRVAGEKYNAWHCPDCGHPLYPPGEPDTLAFWEAFAQGEPPEKTGGYYELVDIPKYGRKPILKRTSNNLPVGFNVEWNKISKIRECQECGSKLRRPAIKARGETKIRPRYAISQILKGLKRHFDLFIYDEIQKASAEGSGRGDAFAMMVKSAKKMLFLTGTLVNGKSTSIKELLWRTDPADLIKEGFDRDSGMVQWAARYGVLKKVTTVIEDDTGYVTRQKRVQQQPTEEPGIAPEMVARHLLHKVAFLELGDLGLPLVKLVEQPVLVELDPEHTDHYSSFHSELYDACKKAARSGSKGAFSKFNPATICYADRPDLGARVKVGGSIIAAPALDYFHAKERALVDMVKKELAENRGVIIGLNFTDSYQCHNRIRDVLKAHGIESHTLTSAVPSEKRVGWLARKEEENAKVIITNLKLVEVGLDLIPWNTLILYQLCEEVNVVRQFARRNWRIGAYRECRVFYMVYNGTTQMTQFLRIMKKRGAAMVAEGRLERSELSKYCFDSRNIMTADVANCLADAKVAEKWQELARRDIDSKVRMVDEKDFKGELEKAMRELVAETLRLCGATVPEHEPELIPELPEVESENQTIEDMWANIVTKKKRKKVQEPENQLSLFEFGFGA